MKKHILFFLIVTLAVAFIVNGVILSTSHTYKLFFTYPAEYDEAVEAEFTKEGILEVKGEKEKNGRHYILLEGRKEGKTDVVIKFLDRDGKLTGDTESVFDFVVTRNGHVYHCNITDINGWQTIVIGITVMLFIFLVYAFANFYKLQKNQLFDYQVIFSFFLFLICLIFAGVFAFASIYAVRGEGHVYSSSCFDKIRMVFFLMNTIMIPFTLLFSVAISISNVSLMRHEGVKPINMLGVIAGLMLTVSTIGATFLYWHFYDLTSKIVLGIIMNLFLLFIISGQLLLLAIEICAFISLRKKHEYDMDYIIILGCGIRKDGTLYPLLKGRADKAIEFYNKQVEKTGKKLYLVPSGGQGNDEIMAEGEAIKRYLLEQGIPETQILAETESKTTMENMRFSKKIIDENIEAAKGLYATTNYHVFRAGLYAAKAGLRCGGIGSKTKWYFWPNAFLREMVGILTAYWRQEILLAVLLTFMSIFMSNVADLINMFS